MKTPRMIANHEKAVVPRQGTAAFSISTQFHQLPNRMAFPAISHGRRDIVLLAYLLGMTDVEIAKRLGLNRSTVQYRRTSTLEQLRKIMEENGYEYHKQ